MDIEKVKSKVIDLSNIIIENEEYLTDLDRAIGDGDHGFNMAKGFNEKVTLREELKFLEDYITIEKMRYMEMFDVETQVEKEELYEAKIIKLTLQPLVENAIFSGIEPGGNGRIL